MFKNDIHHNNNMSTSTLSALQAVIRLLTHIHAAAVLHYRYRAAMFGGVRIVYGFYMDLNSKLNKNKLPSHRSDIMHQKKLCTIRKMKHPILQYSMYGLASLSLPISVYLHIIILWSQGPCGVRKYSL